MDERRTILKAIFKEKDASLSLAYLSSSYQQPFPINFSHASLQRAHFASQKPRAFYVCAD